MAQVPGSAGLVLVEGVAHLDEPAAVFEGMLTGWARQQKSRMLSDATVSSRLSLLRRFTEFAGSYPWSWTPADVEDFTVGLTSGERRMAPATIRGYHLTLRMFCDYLTDARYEWPRQCRDRFGQVPSQVCHEWNTVAHLTEYEGQPARRPLSYDELEQLFDHLDRQVDVIVKSGRKGALAALRDAQMIKTCYAFGLRRNELCRLDVADLRPNPHVPDWGGYGSVHVRYGKAIRGGVPRRRTVLAVPEFDWAIAGLRQWAEQARPILRPADHPALWVTERLTRVSTKHLDKRFAVLRAGAGLAPELTLHCLRHSYVTHLIEFGYPERFVQEQVGHAYASTTAIYTSVSNDFKNKTLQAALGRVYKPPSTTTEATGATTGMTTGTEVRR
ncbi:Integrase [Blastococcus saxobsidens DD2]|uniref:Integrase n=1 Tax=Blastococcus saxobsidens (strain DD2) TaxID=1146883 RepID=H6RP97_BLASD|nr:Integrase [Blastococcus saxobsidens DD2]CCG02758.1 Integrase/recombinase [Blastococcus saxobsidens DD2]CCG03832.1 Putative tyrosine-family recombinase/integrase [Blastococcus saxobsidens DD2]CCG05230.1 Integrase [Blastococcus saxobsidens DD2]